MGSGQLGILAWICEIDRMKKYISVSNRPREINADHRDNMIL